jgi:GNAT superfamily N-acetyltransferase
MAAITTPALAPVPQLRPLNIMRDLPAVADLVEKCFASTMDTEGRRYLQQMRDVGRDNSFLRWANRAVESVSMPLSGYIWEENGEIIGNVSIIPYHRRKRQRIYLIANVAVQTDFRRRGIGRALTVAAMHHAQQRRASAIWLHVREDNTGAVALYEGLGFHERARRTTWQAAVDRNACVDGLGVIITKRNGRHWQQQETWLHCLYPDLLAWYQPMPWLSLRPGLWPALYRMFLDYETRQWTAHLDGRLMAALAWQPVYGQSDRLWVAIPPEGAERALTALLLNARRALAWRQSLIFDFPAGVAVEAIQAAGFSPRRTLLWMQVDETSVSSIRRPE